MYLYDIGDTVKIKTSLISGQWFPSCWVAKEMLDFTGKVATITGLEENSYYIDVDGGEWFWDEGMFEPIESRSPDASLIVGIYTN